MTITFISDIHWQYDQIPLQHFPGGDLLICAGDITKCGYHHEVREFCKFFNNIPNYCNKVFIAGNHDFEFDTFARRIPDILKDYPKLTYIEDDSYNIYDSDSDRIIRLYGSPRTPKFRDFAFMYNRNSEEAEAVWGNMPENTDILITHTPPFGVMDVVKGRTDHLGCEVLRTHVLDRVKPKIHVFGHVHTGFGYNTNGVTHFINAAQLDETYNWNHIPLTIDWNPNTNSIEFL